MRKAAIFVLVLVILNFLLANFVLAESGDDYQAIKKAVKKNPQYKKGKEVKWFKILVKDNRTKKDKVSVTVPICLVELFLKCAEDRHLRIEDECDIDVEKLFKELKELGPMSLIEVYEEDVTVKIWLE